MTTTVIIVTLNRPDCIRRCLECLLSQEPQPDQIIVVDTSADDSTHHVVEEFPEVVYLRGLHGYGHMTASRNLGLKHTNGDIIAFIDDDAFVHSGWLENLLRPYEDTSVGAVGGRALNKQPGEELLGVNEIGRLKSNGVLTGFFAADPGQVIEVDHIIGCNMSFRRTILATLGGLREDYTGTEVREETDICLRVKQLGYKILFNPAACVDHIGAPQAKGKRFDFRYDYYAQRNHVVLLIRNFGPGAEISWHYLAFSVFHSVTEVAQKIGAALTRLGVTALGTVVGLGTVIVLLAKKGRSPIRQDAEGQAIRQALQNGGDNDPVASATLKVQESAPV